MSAALEHSEHRDVLGPEMFRRIVFNVLVNNADDHARNHGFLRTEHDWTLAPAFDVNPHPGALEATPIDWDDDPSDRDLRRLIADRERYSMTLDHAREAIATVAKAAARIPEHARELGATDQELRRFAPVFDSGRFDIVRRIAHPPTASRPTAEDSVRQRDQPGRFTRTRRRPSEP